MPNNPTRSFHKAWIVSLSFVALLWVIHGFAVFNSLHLWDLGITPTTVNGLLGILLAPLIHGDWEHLATNTPSLLILITTLYYGYPRSATRSITIIWLISGLLTWFFGRADTVHYGASGITHSLMFFLFTIGILRRDRLSVALSMVVFFLYGSMVWSVLPNQPNISYEMHLSGAIIGLVIAVLFRKLDHPFPVKRYDWENEEDIDYETDHEIKSEKKGVVYDENQTHSINSNSDDLIGDSWVINENFDENINENLNENNKSPKN